MPLPTGFLGSSRYLPTYNPYTWSGYGSAPGGRWGWTASAQARAAAKPKTLAQQYQDAYAEAKATNEQRYQDILGGYRSREQNAQTLLAGLGSQERAALLKQYGEAASRQRAGLAGRGLGGTSVAGDVEAKLQREQAAGMGQLEERLRREQLGYQTGLSGDTLQFMERREDEYPDIGTMMQLAQLQGRGQGAGGAGYGAMPWGLPMNAKSVSQFFPGMG